MNAGLALVILAVVCFTIAIASVLFDASDPHIYPSFLAAGCALGFTGVKLP